ncbi:ABC transporter permease [Cellulomonas sp. P22]|uniref:ABC transporter permease n=1 Tax=Cellulomonas sp. P22 TaxID=3373189 RepID=UPI00378D041F
MATTSPRADRRVVIGLPVALTLLLSMLLLAFGLPAIHSAPRDVPLALVAPTAVAEQVEAGLEQAQPGAFAITVAPSSDAARTMIEDREVYGALVLGPDGLQIQTATAASPSVAQVVTAVGQALATQLDLTASVEDVVPMSPDDPRGVGLAAGALPIALGGMIAGVAISLAVPGTWRRVGVMLGFAVLAGLAMTAVLQFWFGTLTGSYLATSAAATLGVLATGMTVLGLEQLLGRIGIGLAALVVVILGNPLSGLASAPEMLPLPWGAIGQTLPPGATGTLLRDVAFFDGAAIGAPLLALGTWLVVGVVTFWAGATRPTRSSAQPPQPALAPATEAA